MKGLGDYTIPMANKFAADGDPHTLGEIYAYGFRNAHRLSWDIDGTLFASDIGMNHIEEINIVHNGGNYGFMRREGYWENGRWRGGAMGELPRWANSTRCPRKSWTGASRTASSIRSRCTTTTKDGR